MLILKRHRHRYGQKKIKTSHYIKNNSGFDLWVRSLSSSNVNCTLRDHAIVKGGEWFIYNKVKENGYSSCKLDITTARAGVSGTLRGLWSPDSVGKLSCGKSIV